MNNLNENRKRLKLNLEMLETLNLSFLGYLRLILLKPELV
jgi:hypothetical protein